MKRSHKIMSIVTMVALASVGGFAKVVDYRFEECSSTPETIKNYAADARHGILTEEAKLSKNKSTLALSGKGAMRVAHDSKLDIVGDLTVSLWVNPSVQARQALVTRGGTGEGDKQASNGEYFLTLWEDGTLKYKHNGTADTYSSAKLPLNAWTHVVIRRKPKNQEIRIYLNGQLDATNSYTTTPSSSGTKDLLIGDCEGCSSTMQAMQGELDEIKLYNIVLTDQEIKALYDAEKDGIHALSDCYVSPAPTVVNDTLEVFEEGSVTVNVLENDVDTNTTDTCTIEAASLQFGTMSGATLSQEGQRLTVPAQGVWSVLNGTVLFTPEEGFVMSPSGVRYQVSDSCGTTSDMATVTLTRTLITQDDLSTPEEEDDETTIGIPALVHGDSLYTVGDRVWFDTNANGIQDTDEEGVENVVVALYNSEGSVVQRTNTNASGEYRFDTVSEGTYSLGFSRLPAGYLFTLQYQGSESSSDSDVNSVGRTEQFDLEANRLDLDAGIVPHANQNDENNSMGTSVDTNNSDQNSTTVPHTHGDEECECETYTDSIPSMGQIGVVVMLWLTTLMGLSLIRKEEKSRL